MRGYIPGYDARAPKTLCETLELLHQEPGAWKPIAGGTDLMVLLESGILQHRKFLSIQALRELQGIALDGSRLIIGAGTSFTRLIGDRNVSEHFPALRDAALSVGAVAIQNRGTLGGNIANASPAADTPPALLAYDAELELVSSSGARRIALSDFYLGYKKTALREDELIRAVHLGLPSGRKEIRHFFRKVGTRKAQSISKTCLAALAEVDRQGAGKPPVLYRPRIALGSVAPVPLRCKKTETALDGQPVNESTIRNALAALSSEISPIDDIRSTSDYRRQVSLNVLEEFLTTLT